MWIMNFLAYLFFMCALVLSGMMLAHISHFRDENELNMTYLSIAMVVMCFLILLLAINKHFNFLV